MLDFILLTESLSSQYKSAAEYLNILDVLCHNKTVHPCLNPRSQLFFYYSIVASSTSLPDNADGHYENGAF